MERASIPFVVLQHAEEAAHLRHVRSVLVRAPHVELHRLKRLDDRLLAHLDGVVTAGDAGRRMCMAALESPSVGSTFAATVFALECRSPDHLQRLLAIAQALPSVVTGITSAFGWVSGHVLQGTTRALLTSTSPWQRRVGIDACATHGVQPGAVLDAAVTHEDADLRAAGLAAAARLGQIELQPACERAMGDVDPRLRFAAARAALLLGNRGTAPAMLHAIVSDSSSGVLRSRALSLLLRVSAPDQARAVLKSLSEDAASIRLLMRGFAAAADPHFVPWLIRQMHDDKLTRLAGECFSLITGLDLARLDLERKPPEHQEADARDDPTDDPTDDNVAMDEDDGLPWPDPDKIAAWWSANGQRFVGGARCFMGEPPTPAHCARILKTGAQRQRIAAAEYLTLMKPGTPLFNTCAPAWRQQRLLSQMGA